MIFEQYPHVVSLGLATPLSFLTFQLLATDYRVSLHYNYIDHSASYFPACDPIQTVSGWVEIEGEEFRAELWRGVEWWLETSPGA